MATTKTYYYPSESGWTSGTYSGYSYKTLYFRFRVDQEYDTSVSATKITVRLQMRDPSKNNVWTISANDTVTINGTSYSLAGTFSTGASGDWVYPYKNGSEQKWTINSYSLSNSTLPLACHFDVTYSTWGASFDHSGSVSLNQFPTYALSVSAGIGSTITVTRTASYKGAATGVLSDGATLYHGDTLRVDFAAETGYDLATHTVEGVTFTSGGTLGVNVAVPVVATAVATEYSITIGSGTGYTISVERTSSPIGGGASGSLSDGDTIYYEDVLTVVFTPAAGYTLSNQSVTGATASGGSYVCGANNVSVSVTATPTEHTLTISAGTGTSITVSRTSSPVGGGATGDLSDGDTIYYNDELTVTFTPGTGYDLATHTANGSEIPSGSYTAPDSNVLLAATATVQSFTLTLSAGTGTTITVSRTSSPKQGAASGALSDGDTVYYSDVLSVVFAPQTGYNLATKTINGNAQSNNTVTWTVTAAVLAAATATVKSFLLTVNAGVGSSITVNRTSSPKQGAATGALVDGDTIYYSDELTITFAALTGYSLTQKLVNGSAVSGSSMSGTVTRAITAAATAAGIPITLSVAMSNSGVTVTVFRMASPIGGAALEGQQLSNGDTVYYGDELKLLYSLAPGYTLEESTFNGEAFASNDNVSVPLTGAIVVVLAKAAGFVYIGNQPYLIYIGNGATWDRYLAKIGNGSTYDDY